MDYVMKFEPKKSDRLKAIEVANYSLYKELLRNWDRNSIDEVAEPKALLLDKNDKIIQKLDISKEFPNPSNVFLKAQKENAFSIVLVQNDPEDKVYPDASDRSILQMFKKESSKYKVKFKDFIIFSKWGYYSSLENNKI